MLQRLFMLVFVDRWRREAPTMFDGRLAREAIDACLAENDR